MSSSPPTAKLAESTLRRVLGLLSKRRWWNDNAWAAEQIATDALNAAEAHQHEESASLSDSRRVTSRAENWELIERWVEHYPDDWRLMFKRGQERLEVQVPEDVWRAFDGVRVEAPRSGT